MPIHVTLYLLILCLLGIPIVFLHARWSQLLRDQRLHHQQPNSRGGMFILRTHKMIKMLW